MNLCVKTHNPQALCVASFFQNLVRLLTNKTVLMKVSFLSVFLTISMFLMARESNSQDLNKMTVSIQLKNSTLKHALRKIESLTQLAFTYKTNDIIGYNSINIDGTNISVAKLLDELLRNTDLNYEQVNTNIVIKKIKVPPVDAATVSAPENNFEGGIKGKITDDKGLPIVNASVLILGTKRGTAADANGEFNLTGIKAGNYKIQISAVGFATLVRDITIKDNESLTLAFQMSEDNTRLNDVVVTALGIKREVKTLGYASQQINSAQLTQSQQPNVINALQGKVAGVTISGSGGGPGQGASILIRGINSLDPTRDNQPLFVIDGLPVDNSTNTTGTTGDRGAVLPNRLSDINPEDIESVNVLRGGAATALYGLRGANGVIVITTKSGRAGSLQVHFTSSYSIDQIDKIPDLQLKYTMGFGGTLADYDSTSFWPAWGPTVEEAKTVDPNHPDKLYNNWKRAYNTGHQFRNSLTFSGGTDKATYSSSLSYFKQDGLIPFTWYQDITARVNGSLKFSDQFKMGTSLYYATTDGNFYDANRYNEDLVYWAPRWDVRDYATPEGTMKTYGNDNPMYQAATNKFRSKVDHVVGSVNFTYAPTKWFTATYLLGMDQYNDARTATAPGPTGLPGEFRSEDNDLGFVHEYRINFRQINSNLLLTFNKTWGDKFQTTLRVGHDLLDKSFNRVSALGDELNLYNLFTLGNAVVQSTSEYDEKSRIIGLYGDLTLGYNNYLFLTVTGRNDWTSTLEEDNRSFFYPSVSASYIFSQHLSMPSWVTYGKLRASLAGIGKDALPYKTSVTYAPVSPPLNNDGQSVNRWTRSDNGGIATLKPENTVTFEIGTDLSFLQDRIGLNFTWYKSNSRDQIIPVATSASTGFRSISLNAGEIQNTGVELTLKGTPVKSQKFNWDLIVNVSHNTNKIVSIYPGVERIAVGDPVFGYGRATVSTFYVPGESAGAIFGTPIMRYGDDKGTSLHIDKSKPWLIGDNGFPVYPASSNQRILGNAYPKWLASIGNTFSYKNWSLYFLWDIREGVQKFDQFANFLAAFGESKMTLNRNDLVTFKGVLADGTENTKQVWLGMGDGPDGNNYGNGYYRNIYRGISENFVENASWIRLRTTTLTYHLPQRLFSHSFVKNISLSFTGNNLILITPFTGFDPESRSDAAAGSNQVISGGFSYPALRNYIFTLNLGL